MATPESSTGRERHLEESLPDALLEEIEAVAVELAHLAGAEITSTLGREITYVDAPDDAVRDAPPGFGLDEWFVNALAGLSGLTADPASMATPARSARPWRGSLDSLRDLSTTCSRKWLLS